MATNAKDPYTNLHEESGKMVMAAKYGGWDTVWEILNRKPYLVNCIPEERAWAILHQAVWWKDAIAVKKILAVPGCDSELLTKNGLRPLDIETTAEIRKLLEQHIAQVNGWEETPQTEFIENNKKEMPQGDIAVENKKETLPANSKFNEMSKKTSKPISNGSKQSFKKETPSTNSQINEEKTYDELVEESEQHTKVITKEAKSKNWKKLFSLLDKWKNLVNKTDPDTGMAPLHYAAEANDVEAVQKILYYPASDPAVKTAKRSFYGAGKTAAKITTSPEVKAAIRWREQKLQEKHKDVPTFVSIYDSNLILMRYTAKAMEESKGDICDTNLDIDELKLFPDMGKYIFDFINTGNANWKNARKAVAKEIYQYDATKKLKAPTTSKDFFIELIQIYTDKFYSHFNSILRDQATDQKYRKSKSKVQVYAALVNSLLFGNFLKTPVWTNKTYRGMDLGNNDISKYTKGKEFAWLSLTSSSGKEEKAFGRNCKFIIDNSQSCIWSPRLVSSLSVQQAEDEYLYPCGAQFRVTKVRKGHILRNSVMTDFTEIYIKLICVPDPWIFGPIYTTDLETQLEKIKGEFKVLAGVREELTEINDKMKGTRQTIQDNKDYEKQIIENKVRRRNIRSNEAYYCNKCNYTCHYPCPESDMKQEGRCIISGPVAQGHCEKCPQKCHFNSHTKVNFVNEIKSKSETKVDKKKKSRFDSAKEIESETEELLAKEQNHFDAIQQDILEKIGQWDVMTLQFEKKLCARKAPVKEVTENLIRLYTEMKVDVQTIRMELEGAELN